MNTMALILVGVALVGVGVVLADIQPYHPPVYQPPHQPSYNHEPKMPHRFDYAVKDDYAGTDFGHNEESDGNTVRGSYVVQLPDGRKQTVNYEADHQNGYIADVQYYGEAQYAHQYGPPITFKPQAYGHPQPPYHAPEPPYHPPEPSYHPVPVYPPPHPTYP